MYRKAISKKPLNRLCEQDKNKVLITFILLHRYLNNASACTRSRIFLNLK